MKRSLLLGILLVACAHAPAEPSSSPPRVPVARTPLSLTYLGVAGWQISDGTHVVLVDPHFSRPDLAAGTIGPDPAAIAAHAPAAAHLILISHSHWDHALDAAAVAMRTGAEVLGTVSTARLARAGGVPEARVIPVKGGEDYQFDGFSVRVLPSLHSALDGKHTFGGGSEIAEGVTLPMAAGDYREGGTLAFLVRMGGHQVLVLGTANFIERELDGLRPDVAIVATGLRDELTDYGCRLMRALGQPPLVVANHFDNFKQPATGPLARLDADTRADLDAFRGEIAACAPGSRVVVPEHFQAIPWP